jgi:spermidine synthase
VSALYPLLVLSGAAALAVEVVWSRVLHRLLGSSSLAAAIVLASFLGGMGLGALLAERRLLDLPSVRRRPLLAAGALEGASAVASVAASALLIGLAPLFRAAAGEVFAVLVVVAATLPLGASFPVLLAALPDDGLLARRVRRLYGANALGGGAGALAAGLVAVPILGERALVGLAAALQVLVAAGIALLGRGLECAPPATVTVPVRGRGGREGASFVFLSGFVVCFWEVLWMRILVLTVGSSVYAFSTVAASVVLGIGAGSLAFGGRLLAKSGAWFLPLVTLAAALAAYLAVPFLPDAYLFGVRALGLEPLACGAFGASLIAFAPNFLLGALFPWFLGRRVHLAGSLYALNSVGAILGAFAAGPLAAGRIGLEATYRLGLAALALLVLAGAFLPEVREAARRRPVRLARLASALAACVVVLSLADCIAAAAGWRLRLWDPERLLSGIFQWSRERMETGSLAESYAGRELLVVVEGREVIVSAERDDADNALFLKANGKVEGGVPLRRSAPSGADMPTQLLLGAAGGVLGREHPDAPCLLIGLGSGVTLAALVDMRSRCGIEAPLDVVEIEPAFLDVARHDEVRGYLRPWFDPERLPDTVRFRFGDARRVLAAELRGARYGVIVSQPSEPWIAGAAPLFTVEFFQEAAAALLPGGAIVQWVQLDRLETESLRLLLRTIQRVFAEVHLLRPPGTGELIVLASREPLDLTRFLDAPGLAMLRESGLSAPIGWLAIHLAGPAGVRAWAGASPPLRLNTDERGELEFAAPRTLHRGIEVGRRNLAALRECAGSDPVTRYLPDRLRTAEQARLLARGNVAMGDLAEARAILAGDDSAEAQEILETIDAREAEGGGEGGAEDR